MKLKIKKNQVIVTTLAIMIAVAGYLNYAGSKLGEEGAPALAENQSILETEGMDTALIDVESMDQDLPEDSSVADTPGEAVLTSISGGAGFAAQARLSREQVRAQNKESLLEVINNENIDEAEKQEAIDAMTNMTQRAEMESAAEMLLESKGFTNCVVSLTTESADVVVGDMTELSDTQLAQIEDIVKRKTGMEGASIVITTAKESE